MPSYNVLIYSVLTFAELTLFVLSSLNLAAKHNTHNLKNYSVIMCSVTNYDVLSLYVFARGEHKDEYKLITQYVLFYNVL